MKIKKSSKFGRLKAIFGGFLVFLGILAGVLAPITTSSDLVYADPPETPGTTETTETPGTTGASETTESETAQPTATVTPGETCTKSLGAMGWLICPLTGKISEAVDWLYEKIEDLLVINPVEAKDGTPIYEIWKYCLNITNIVFIIFLLVVIYSQLTGFGINNYGVKKALPKLIVAAILVNLSFLICVIAVDVSNIIGKSLRGVFISVQEATIAASGNTSLGMHVPLATMYSALAGGATLAIGAAFIAFETGAIWMLIPVAFGAIVSVASGLITIAMRQAVVALLIMIAPLAFVAYILPNTEGLFKKWKSLFIRMLTFYPLFSLLFGASQLAGYALIASAKDGFWMILGVAVQVFPLFFSWSLMRMSGTFLGDINTRLRGLTSGMVARNRAWADSHRQLSKQRHLAEGRPTTPSLRLMQFMSMRKIQRDAETAEQAELVKARAMSRRVRSFYDKNGVPNRRGEEEYADQARKMRYQYDIERHAHNMNLGLGQLKAVQEGEFVGKAKKARLGRLDIENMNAADALKMEAARGEMIEYDNARGFHNRMEAAINSHFDDLNAGNDKYKRHEMSETERAAARARYTTASTVMEGNLKNIQYAAASAAQGYDTQKKIVETKMQKYFELTPPTKDVEYRLGELTMQKNAQANIDAILPGLRILNQRGDTDIVQRQMDNILNKNIGGGIELGTHASQALASFLMFEVKDNDPFLRRFGKYINLETARAYNANDRKVMNVTYDEYVKGYHDGEPDTAKYPEGRMYAKKGMKQLTEGTSLDNIERTALSNLDESLKRAYGFDDNNKDKEWDVKGYLKKREEIQTAFEPAFLSASLKWLSGSEQINSGVKFWTGYEVKQKKDKDGKLIVDENGNPEYDLSAVWDDKDSGFKGHEKEIEEYYRKKTRDYIKDQTTGQILGMRTDYRDAVMEHFANMFLEDSSEEETSDERKAEFSRARDEIQTRYGDKTLEEAKKLREKDLKKLKAKMASAQIRKTLGETGKLEQIYRTRRSGAANNAKDWWREWIGLDDEDTLFKEVQYYRAKKGETSEGTGTNDPEDWKAPRVYNERTSQEFIDNLDDVWDKYKDVGMNGDDFYEIAKSAIKRWFYGMPSVLEHKFDDFYRAKRRVGIPDAYALKEELENLLRDLSNYPDA